MAERTVAGASQKHASFSRDDQAVERDVIEPIMS